MFLLCYLFQKLCWRYFIERGSFILQIPIRCQKPEKDIIQFGDLVVVEV